MNTSAMYEYVVLRLSPNIMRGETINVGLVVFAIDQEPIVRITAPIAKVHAIDPGWDSESEKSFSKHVSDTLKFCSNKEEAISLLASIGLSHSGEPGFFYATPSGLDQEIRQVSNLYVATKIKQQRPRRSRLHKEMMDRFKSMDLLGHNADDLTKHRVVPHLPIPGNPDLKGDFVYKNGVYRITQTLDYRVSTMGARQKVSEACTKVMAAAEGAKAWGDDTMKFAIVNVPHEVADIADSHLDLLFTSGFAIFHANSKDDLAKYHSLAFSH